MKGKDTYCCNFIHINTEDPLKNAEFTVPCFIQSAILDNISFKNAILRGEI